jgi:hypothetical protein
MYFLHKVQLHVSALDDGHLQVVHEILIKQLYKTYMGCLYGFREGVKWARDFVCVGKVGRCRLHEGSMLLPSYV